MRTSILFLLFLLIFTPCNSFATTVNYADFSDITALTLSNDATTTTTVADGTVLRLTPDQASKRGSAFGTEQINASNFSTYFQFRITNPGGSLFDGNTDTGADGIVFVIQNVSASIGGAGQGIGYSGIADSVGVEFDTWHNSYNNDPNSNHIGIDTEGIVNHGAGSPNTVNVATRFDDGNIWHSWIDYNGTTLEVRANQTGIRPTDAILSSALDIPDIIGQNDAWVGFTSGTGADWGNHDIVSWEYRDFFEPIDNTVPEPTTMILFGFGLLGLAGISRRKK